MRSIRDEYGRVTRRVLALTFVLFIAVAGVIDSEVFQLSAILALALVILETLFSLESEIEPAVEDRWFQSSIESLPAVQHEIGTRLEAGSKVEPRGIGITQEAGRPFCQNFFRDWSTATNARTRIAVAVADHSCPQVPAAPDVTRPPHAARQLRAQSDRHVFMASAAGLVACGWSQRSKSGEREKPCPLMSVRQPRGTDGVIYPAARAHALLVSELAQGVFYPRTAGA